MEKERVKRKYTIEESDTLSVLNANGKGEENTRLATLRCRTL